MLSAMTFEQWFDDYCANPANTLAVAHLYTDRQYFLLLRLATTSITVAELDCTGQEQKWLYHRRSDHVFRAVVMAYGAQRQVRQMGHVLHEVLGRPAADSPIPLSALRRVISIRQIVEAVTYCHADATGHRGQDATADKVNSMFEGVSRVIIREAVRRCAICQLKSAKQNKAKLQPIIAPQLFDRLLIDLIDKHRQPDHGYHYIMHVADHHSRYHFIRPLKSKQASSVADELRYILADIGSCRVLQSDQGPEFKGEVAALCERFGILQVKSSPYTPSTNGLIEKWNHVVKVGIAAWQAEHGTNSWVACLPQLQVQMNTTWTRSLRTTPYELVFGQGFRFHVRQVLASASLNHLDDQEWEADPDEPEAPLRPPPALLVYRVDPDPTPSPPPPHPPPRPAQSTPAPSRSSPSRPSPSSQPVLLADEAVQDCSVGATGELGRLCAGLLNVGGLHFRRWGCIGRGRCGVAAVELAVRNCRLEGDGSIASTEAFCDDERASYANRLELYADDGEREVWLQQMVDVGGGDFATGKQTPAQARTAVRRALLRDLRDNDCNLGWEFLVLAAATHQVNILLIPVVVTGEPMEAVTPQLIPLRWDEQSPVIVIYHRAYYQAAAGADADDCFDTGGHYEVLFIDNPRHGYPKSYFQPGDAAYDHLRRLGAEVLARAANAIATFQMERNYNLNVRVRDFAVGDPVGVRTNNTKQRTKKRGVLNIPGLIVSARDNVRVGGSTIGQRLYVCLTKYGIIDLQLKVDRLVYVSANNHSRLFDILRQHLTDGTWRQRPKITVEAAVKAFLRERASATAVSAPRQQQSRRAKGGEDDVSDDTESGDEEQVGEQREEVDSPLTISQAQHYPIRILRHQGTRYLVEWNDPPGEKTWETVSRWDRLADYRDLVIDFRAREEKEKEMEEEKMDAELEIVDDVE